jgi:hypothetical protein
VTRPRRPRQCGQTLVEFALAVPLFVLALFGLLDMGRAVYTFNTLSQATREGARLAAVEAGWLGSTDPSCGTPGGPVCPADANALARDVTVAVNRMVVGLDPIRASQVNLTCDAVGSAPTGTWSSSSCANPGTGNVVSVRVTYTYVMLTPIVGQIINGFPLSASATMVIN